MNKRKIVFDVDDVLWDLNKIATSKAGVDYNKLEVFSANENPLLSEEERSQLIRAYCDPDSFKNIDWYDGIEDIVKLEKRGAEVYINSNSANIEISELKRKQLKSVLGLPDNRLILNIMNNPKKKEVGEGVWCFVDDSPHNILDSTAVHNIVVNKPWNTSRYSSELLEDKFFVRLNSLKEVLNHINCLLNY